MKFLFCQCEILNSILSGENQNQLQYARTRRSSFFDRPYSGSIFVSRRESVPGEGRVRCTSISMKTYKPHLICETRRKVEDLCRDLVVNNDHIHLVEMRLRDSISKEPVKISKPCGRGGRGRGLPLFYKFSDNPLQEVLEFKFLKNIFQFFRSFQINMTLINHVVRNRANN